MRSKVILNSLKVREFFLRISQHFQLAELEFPDKDHAILWVLKNQLGRRNLNDYHFALLVGQEYELEKKLHGGDRKSEEFKESIPQNEGMISSTETAERLAKEHGLSRATVERSADLF
jgi:hypothetical protein